MRKRTHDEMMADHERVEKLSRYLDRVPGHPVEWSDGDKLRLLAFRHFMASMSRGDCVHDDEVAVDICRMAERLDALDRATRPDLDAMLSAVRENGEDG